jgi:hypothetical protein
MQTHEHHSDGPATKKTGLPVKAGIAASGIIVTPYIADLVNPGAGIVEEITVALHGTGLGNGLAGGFNALLNSIPIVGETLAAGGVATAASSGIIGIGGVLLGNYIEKRQAASHSGQNKTNWGKIIKYAALTTSMLIALPSILTGLSVGLTYLASLGGVSMASSAATFLSGTLGSIGAMEVVTAGAGISSIFTHLLTCGGAALSMAGAMYLDSHSHNETPNRSVSVEMVNDGPVKAGKPYKLAFRISDETGKNLTDADLRETYTKKLHVMLVDSSLSDYHHIHPEYDKNIGLFTASFIPAAQGKYNVWNNFTLRENGLNAVLKNEIPAERDYAIPPVIQHTQSVGSGDINITIEAYPPLSAYKTSLLKIQIKNKLGNDLNLEQIMGAPAHLAGFSKDGEHSIHCHPVGSEPDTYKRGSEKTLEFHVEPEREGFTKFFLQLKTGGKEIVIPFGQYVQPASKLATRAERSARTAAQHKHAVI